MTTPPTTPAVRRLSAADIDKYKMERRPTEFGGCFMCHGLFVKADGGLGCSCQIGYYSELGSIHDDDMGEFVKGDLLRYIRESFREGFEPFEMCGKCYSKLKTYPDVDLETAVFIHAEPSNSCNLWCGICLCTDERRSANPPPRVNLDYAAFEKMLRDIQATGLPVSTLALVGYGEPLFNSDTPRMAALGRSLFPNAYIFLDTNCNFGPRRAKEIADCGLTEIRLALDGADQESYQAYREGGSFAKALAFTRHLLAEIAASGSRTRAIWKYILFNHNDSDAQIALATALAKALGVEIQFDDTFGARSSRRPRQELEAAVGSARIKANLDMEAQRMVDRHLAQAASED